MAPFRCKRLTAVSQAAIFFNQSCVVLGDYSKLFEKIEEIADALIGRQPAASLSKRSFFPDQVKGRPVN